MKLSDLAGKNVLDAVDFSSESIKEEYGEGYEDCNVCRFRLNGVVYVAVEDPNDGYRSSMRELFIDQSAMKNVFKPVDVFCLYKDKNNYNASDILIIYDLVTAKPILEVGTEYTDDYYPCYVSSFHPENICIND